MIRLLQTIILTEEIERRSKIHRSTLESTFGVFRIFYKYMVVECMIRLLYIIILTEEIERASEIHRSTFGRVIYLHPHALSPIVFLVFGLKL